MSAMDGLAGVTGPGAASRVRTLRDVEPQPGISLQPAEAAKPDFAATLKGVLAEVNELQLHSDEMLARFAAGEVQNLHDVVIAQQEAAIAFRLVQEVRDKLIQGYQDLMRMQV
jgi:flagellar hook-basal body complex protein FliE